MDFFIRFCKKTYLVFLACCVFYSAALTSGELSTEADLVHAGYFKLAWPTIPGDSFILEESDDAVFLNPDTLHIHNEDSITLTGRDNGSYYYRIINSKDEPSNVIQVTVEHHPLEKAYAFFTLGLCLFIILVIVLGLGHESIKMDAK